MIKKILVTGAAGKTGRAVIQALASTGIPVRSLVYRDAQVSETKVVGARETIVGDMRQAAVMNRAVEGVSLVYHICPNMSPYELEIGRHLVSAAAPAGVDRIVYHSVLHPQIEAMPHHWTKLRVEEALFESEVGYTILQPAAYMQNILAGWETMKERGEYVVPYSVDTRIGMVDLEDVAEAARVVLTEPGHEWAIYELAGQEILSQVDVAQILSRELSRPIKASSIPLKEWTAQARTAGLGEYQVNLLVRMFKYYEQYGFWGNSRVLAHLLGRKPGTFADFVRRAARERGF